MKYIIKELLPEYVRTDRHGKTEITEKIVQTIRSEGGRFLRSFHEKGAKQERWEEVSFDAARQKVGHTIRDGNKRTRGERAS